jgi:uncharacterized membrane protein
LYRGLTGRCFGYKLLGLTSLPEEGSARGARFALPHPAGPPRPVMLQQAITINRPPSELAALWDNPETWNTVLGDLGDVRTSQPRGGESEAEWIWRLRAPFGRTVEVRTRQSQQSSPEGVRWQSLPDEPLQFQCSMDLEPAPADWGTVATLRMTLEPPGGHAVASLVEKLLGTMSEAALLKALRRFKSLAEAGEVPTTLRNPAARGDGQDS